MRMVKQIAIALALLPLAFFLFAPKEELYYLLEQRLKKQQIVIANETLTEGLFGLILEHPEFYFNGSRVAVAERIEIWSLLFYTHVGIVALQPDAGLQKMFPVEMERGAIAHTVAKPTEISIASSGSYGRVEGSIDLRERVIRIDIVEPKRINAVKSWLKKGKEGWYYEQSF